ncbi:hypothetical protein [Flavobacterium psychrophilum]|uniref:Uncharacterized protein n=1 Tax=Flavobacterium psychrophilum TaxID=96345 RepID=A0A7U2NGJ8_FLAPS|nr:hypothetical protein [Flavobacterium psychrophilum]MBF2025094.1 hypothetical protein [Flavobacterium psychrophilum]MCB5984093.1 hypothetical protein [Flavobacterium psychrophilum]MCB5995507.1 hypothetical protein [Flavobacterium psychrophilum]MCB5997923.1 hypothetical protein [Flavobacterium psychrophilum]MCB6005409.1 hypothetical protein [Flavobacterium psychrophilum]
MDFLLAGSSLSNASAFYQAALADGPALVGASAAAAVKAGMTRLIM